MGNRAGLEVFADVLKLLGLPLDKGDHLLRRSLRHVGALPETAETSDYAEALPELRARLLAYVSKDEAKRIANLVHQRVAGGMAPGAPSITSVARALRRANDELERDDD